MRKNIKDTITKIYVDGVYQFNPNDPIYKTIKTEVVKDVLWIIRQASWGMDGTFVTVNDKPELFYRAKDVESTLNTIRDYGDVKR